MLTFSNRYSIGDNVWMMHNNMPCKVKVIGIIGYVDKKHSSLLYEVSKNNYKFAYKYSEQELFETKEELIKSLIKQE